MQCETITLNEGQNLTGLPTSMIQALADLDRIPAERGDDGQVYVGKAALLSWCRLYARILGFVARRNRVPTAGYSAFELVWMTRHGAIGMRANG